MCHGILLKSLGDDVSEMTALYLCLGVHATDQSCRHPDLQPDRTLLRQRHTSRPPERGTLTSHPTHLLNHLCAIRCPHRPAAFKNTTRHPPRHRNLQPRRPACRQHNKQTQVLEDSRQLVRLPHRLLICTTHSGASSSKTQEDNYIFSDVAPKSLSRNLVRLRTNLSDPLFY